MSLFQRLLLHILVAVMSFPSPYFIHIIFLKFLPHFFCIDYI
nr:MAG TPA: hypothetical protein [Caudoviricetes sp.]